MISIIPFGDRMLVKFLPKEDVVGTLVLPDVAGQRSWLAEVMAVGEKVNLYKPGDIVLLSFYTGIIINLYENHWLSTAVRMVTQDEALGLAVKENAS